MIGEEVQVLIGAYITKVDSSWKVEIVAFTPGGGEYVDSEAVFDSFEDAEKKAWEKAQRAVEVRKKSS